MNDKFEPTHRIIADGEEILVQEFDGGDYKILMTAEEFEAETLSDWTVNSDCELEFQGSIVYPYHEVRLIRLNPRS